MKKFLKCLGVFLICAGISGFVGCANDSDSSKSLKSIEITKKPESCVINTTLDQSTIEVTATYSDDSKSTVTGFTVTGFDSSKTGTCTITVSYAAGGVSLTKTFDLQIVDKAVKSIEITTQPTKTTYWINQILDTTGMVVTATYNDGTTKEASGWTAGDFDSSSAGTKNVIINYSESGVNVWTNLVVTVEDVRIVSLNLSQEPTKKDYYVGEKLDLTGIVLNAIYDNNSSLRVNDGYTVASESITSWTGTKAVTVSYMGKSVSYNITVSAKYEFTFETGKTTAPEAIKGEGSDISVTFPAFEFEGKSVVEWIDDSDTHYQVGDTEYYNNVTESTFTKKFTACWDITTVKSLTNYVKAHKNAETKEVSITLNSPSTELITALKKIYDVWINLEITGDFEVSEKMFVNPDERYSSTFKSIILPSSVKSIGSNAFYDCYNLTSVYIPEGVTSIGENAFYHCYNLTSITIPSSVTSIGEFAFYNCYNLTSVYIPEGVTSIGDCAFGSCTKLSSITISSGVTSIGRGAFVGSCGKVTSITIPASVKYISITAFYTYNSSVTVTFEDPAGWSYSNDGEKWTAVSGDASYTSSYYWKKGE